MSDEGGLEEFDEFLESLKLGHLFGQLGVLLDKLGDLGFQFGDASLIEPLAARFHWPLPAWLTSSSFIGPNWLSGTEKEPQKNLAPFDNAGGG